MDIKIGQRRKKQLKTYWGISIGFDVMFTTSEILNTHERLLPMMADIHIENMIDIF